MVRAPPLRGAHVQLWAHARCRAAVRRFRDWLYVAREWRQNLNEQPPLEARLPPTQSQVRSGRVGRLGGVGVFEFSSAGGLSL